MRKRVCVFFLILFLSLSVCNAFADDSISIDLQELDWNWEPLSSATFEGVLSFSDQAPEHVIVKLSMSVFPEDSDPGEVVIQSVNGKALTLRKQKPVYSLTRGDEDTFRFTGSWKTPEKVFFRRVEIVCSIDSEDESELYSRKNIVFSRSASEIAEINDGKIRLKTDFTSWTLYICIAAAVIWILAVIRIIINKKGRER